MMGGQPGMQEDLFGKLEGMREVISEVNTQFKDPVCANLLYFDHIAHSPTGKDDLCLCLHL